MQKRISENKRTENKGAKETPKVISSLNPTPNLPNQEAFPAVDYPNAQAEIQGLNLEDLPGSTQEDSAAFTILSPEWTALATPIPSITERGETSLQSDSNTDQLLNKSLTKPLSRPKIIPEDSRKPDSELNPAISGSDAGGGYPFTLAALRKFMTDCFNDTEIRTIVHDDPELREIRHSFGDGMGKNQIIQVILDYAERKQKLGYLLPIPSPIRKH